MALILIVEDELALADMVSDGLTLAGHKTLVAFDGMAGLSAAREHKPDLIIADIGLPKLDGFEMVRTLRHAGNETPVIFLTARQQKRDLIEGFEVGGDDYLAKPFVLQELVVRAKAILRRSGGLAVAGSLHRCGPIEIDDELHIVKVDSAEVELTRTEYALLLELVKRKGKLIKKRDLLQDIWGMGFASGATVLDTYISYLRRKLHTKTWDGIKTVRGEGFKITD
jgi:two-component system OmpR family response regulator